jgi:transcriptional regulator with XRE-family HTH domain
MYPNFNAERTRKKITLKHISEESGLTLSTVSLKLSGKAPITVSEAKQFKKIIKSELPLEVLFSTEVIEPCP